MITISFFFYPFKDSIVHIFNWMICLQLLIRGKSLQHAFNAIIDFVCKLHFTISVLLQFTTDFNWLQFMNYLKDMKYGRTYCIVDSKITILSSLNLKQKKILALRLWIENFLGKRKKKRLNCNVFTFLYNNTVCLLFYLMNYNCLQW